MIDQFETAVKTIATATKTNVIPTSWLSTQSDWTLPAIVIDLEAPTIDVLTEDGVLVERASQMSATIHVKADKDVIGALRKLEDLFWKAINALALAYPNKQIIFSQQPIPDVVPFGKTQAEAFALSFYFSVTDGE